MSAIIDRAVAAVTAAMLGSGTEEGGWAEAGFSEPYTVKVDGNIDPIVIACAVIEAMREPTDEMLEVAIAPYRYGNTEQFSNAMREAVRGYWRAGIGAALA